MSVGGSQSGLHVSVQQHDHLAFNLVHQCRKATLMKSKHLEPLRIVQYGITQTESTGPMSTSGEKVCFCVDHACSSEMCASTNAGIRCRHRCAYASMHRSTCMAAFATSTVDAISRATRPSSLAGSCRVAIGVGDDARCLTWRSSAVARSDASHQARAPIVAEDTPKSRLPPPSRPLHALAQCQPESLAEWSAQCVRAVRVAFTFCAWCARASASTATRSRASPSSRAD